MKYFIANDPETIEAIFHSLKWAGLLEDWPGPAEGLSSLGLGALAFFGIGSFVTLALAPVLIIETQARVRRLATR